jgi:hypothetical protein
MSERTAKKHLAMLATLARPDRHGRPITENEITALCSFMNRHAMNQAKPEPFADELAAAMNYQRPTACFGITQEQTTKGLDWILANRRRKILKDAFTATDWSIIDNFGRFYFMGLKSSSNGYRTFWTRVYRVQTMDGSCFDYTCEVGRIAVIFRSKD